MTLQSLDAIDDTIDLADEVLGTSSDAVTALAGSLAAVSGSFEAATQAIDDIAGLATTVGPSLEDAGRTVRTLESIGSDIDSVLATLSNLPLAPDYNPDAGLGETLGQLAETLETLPGQLESTATSLTEFTGRPINSSSNSTISPHRSARSATTSATPMRWSSSTG